MRRLATLVAVAMVCVGLAGCSQDIAKPPPTTSPTAMTIGVQQKGAPPVVLAPPTTVEGASSSVATSFLTNTLWHSIPAGERQILAPLGQVQIIFLAPGSDPKGACKTLETIFGTIPPSELHLLPVEAAILLPGCLVGQMP